MRTQLLSFLVTMTAGIKALLPRVYEFLGFGVDSEEHCTSELQLYYGLGYGVDFVLQGHALKLLY